MNEASGKLLELALNGRGRDLGLLLAISQLTRNADAVFDPCLTPAARRKLTLLARVSSVLVEGKFNPVRFSSALTRGRWSVALESASELAKECGVSDGEAFSALLGLVLVPACYIDHFTLAAVSRVEIPDLVSNILMREPPQFAALCKSWTRRPTRGALIS